MDHETTLGQTDLRVPRLGLGAMTWGERKWLARWTPAQPAAENAGALSFSLTANEVEAIDQATFAWGKSGRGSDPTGIGTSSRERLLLRGPSSKQHGFRV